MGGTYTRWRKWPGVFVTKVGLSFAKNRKNYTLKQKVKMKYNE